MLAVRCAGHRASSACDRQQLQSDLSPEPAVGQTEGTEGMPALLLLLLLLLIDLLSFPVGFLLPLPLCLVDDLPTLTTKKNRTPPLFRDVDRPTPLSFCPALISFNNLLPAFLPHESKQGLASSPAGKRRILSQTPPPLVDENSALEAQKSVELPLVEWLETGTLASAY